MWKVKHLTYKRSYKNYLGHLFSNHESKNSMEWNVLKEKTQWLRILHMAKLSLKSEGEKTLSQANKNEGTKLPGDLSSKIY